MTIRHLMTSVSQLWARRNDEDWDEIARLVEEGILETTGEYEWSEERGRL